jgi:hypothetical protein
MWLPDHPLGYQPPPTPCEELRYRVPVARSSSMVERHGDRGNHETIGTLTSGSTLMQHRHNAGKQGRSAWQL